MNRLAGELDAVLHLLDRQVVDVDGRLVCKVDDVELTEWPDGSLAVTALLAGPAALIPRFSGSLSRSLLEQWRRLGAEQADRTTPRRIDLEVVAGLGSDVRLSVPGDGLLVRQPPPPQGLSRHRLGGLLGMTVIGPDERLGNVVDVRLQPERDRDAGRLLCAHLVVGRGRPGSMLGYDRSDSMGPPALRRVVRWLHRHTGQLAVGAVVHIDWEAGRVTVDRGLEALSSSKVS